MMHVGFIAPYVHTEKHIVNAWNDFMYLNTIWFNASADKDKDID